MADQVSAEDILAVARINSIMALKHAPRVVKRDAEDVFQEACIGAIKAAGRYRTDKGAAFKTFAASASFGAAVESYRRGRYPRAHEPINASIVNIPALATQPAIASKVIASALRILSDKQMKVIVLVHFKQLSQIEVAQRLGLRTRYVSTLYCQALKILRSHLERRYKLSDLL